MRRIDYNLGPITPLAAITDSHRILVATDMQNPPVPASPFVNRTKTTNKIDATASIDAAAQMGQYILTHAPIGNTNTNTFCTGLMRKTITDVTNGTGGVAIFSGSTKV